jgi:hypothetical protein
MAGVLCDDVFMLTSGGLRVKHVVQRGILGTSTAFALGPRKTTENLDRVNRLQDRSSDF